jgi:hypothetical protein
MICVPRLVDTQFGEAGGAYYLRTELIPDLVSGLFGVYPLTGALKKVAMPSHRKLGTRPSAVPWQGDEPVRLG